MATTTSPPDQETDGGAEEPAEGTPVARLVHPRANRWMHWINFPLITIMIWSGLRIYWASDIYRIGFGDTALFSFFPDSFYNSIDIETPLGQSPTVDLGLRARLARGLAFHFTFGWLFVINGLAYLIYLAKSGSWRTLVPDRQAFRDAGKVVMHDLGLRKEEPAQGQYNAMQQITYSGVIFLGIAVVVSGFAIFKPTQLSWLTTAMGGYGPARAIHFYSMLGFLGFFVLHIIQVARAGLGNLLSMITGYERISDDKKASR